jgi:hypothetical protein
MVSVSLSVHPSIRPSVVGPSIRPSVRPSGIRPSIRPSSVSQSVCPSSIRPSFVNPSSVHQSVRPSVRPSSVHPSVSPLSFRRCLSPSVRPSRMYAHKHSLNVHVCRSVYAHVHEYACMNTYMHTYRLTQACINGTEKYMFMAAVDAYACIQK